MNPVYHTIHVYALNERFSLTIEENCVHEGERDERRCLTHEGGVSFRTDKGKKWFLRFSEFAFVFPRTSKAEPAPSSAVMEAVA